MVSSGAISTILDGIQSKFRGLDRRIHSAHEKFESYYKHNDPQYVRPHPYREEGPAEAALETLETLEKMEKEIDSCISAIAESNSALEAFCEETLKQVMDLGRSSESLMDYAVNNYGTVFPPTMRETLGDILESRNEVVNGESHEGEENEAPKEEAEEPNLLRFGISKYGLQKCGYAFYSKEPKREPEKESFESLQKPHPIIAPIASQPILPQFNSPLLKVNDDSTFQLKPLDISIPSPLPLREQHTYKPEEISPGLFIRVRASKGRKTLEASTMSHTLPNQSPIPPSALLKMCESNDFQKEKVHNKGLNESFGPPPKPKLFTRDFR